MKIFNIFRKSDKNIKSFKKVFVIINPAAGQKRKERFIAILENFFKKLGIEYSYYITKGPGEATLKAKEAAKNGYDLILGAGGDGTINEIVNGIMDEDVVLGIIPLGTVNILSMELGIEQNISRALSLVKNGKIFKMDVGVVNDKYFLLMVGAGFDSYAIYRVNLKLKKYVGVLAYLFAGIYSLFKYKPKKIMVNIDNHRIDEIGYFVIVENVDSYGGKFKVAPYAKFNDKLLDVCVFKKYSLWDSFRYFIGVALNRHLNFPDVRYYQCKTVSLSSTENVLVHSDGDLTYSLPVDIKIAKRQLKILRPDV